MMTATSTEMEFGVRFNTRLPLERVEEWLDGNCAETWDVRLSGIVEDPDGRLWKQLDISFACSNDRSRFRQHFAAKA